MLEEDIYTYMPWPWMSKSAVISDDFHSPKGRKPHFKHTDEAKEYINSLKEKVIKNEDNNG